MTIKRKYIDSSKMGSQGNYNFGKLNFIFKYIRDWKTDPILYKNELSRLSSGKKIKISHYFTSIPEIIDQIQGNEDSFYIYFDKILRLELLTDEVIENWFYKYRNKYITSYYFADLRKDVEKVDLKMELTLYLTSDKKFKISSRLIDFYFDPNYQNYKGETFFHILFKNGDNDIFEGRLGDRFITKNLKRMKDINLKSDKGETLLMIASRNRGCRDFIPSLLKCGSDINILDSEENTPLFIAAKFNNFENVKILLEAGSDVHHKNKKGHDIYICMKNMKIHHRSYIQEFILTLNEKRGNIKGAIKREEEK